MHLLRACNADNSCSKDCSLSYVTLASIVMVLRCMSRKMSDVVGPSTLNGLMGTLRTLHSVSMALRLCSHISESAGPTVKKLSK